MWASKLKYLLNSNSSCSGDLSLTVHSKISSTGLSELSVTDLDVCEALQRLKGGKKDTDNLSSDHLHHAVPVIAAPLATLFTAILRHGYMPNSFCNCTVVPIPKGPKDVTCGSNYRGIAIASTISKVLSMLLYSAFLASRDYQFGFKSGLSTTLCTGVLKATVSRYIHRNSNVYGCFLDASKAFDLVNHKLFLVIYLTVTSLQVLLGS